MCCLLTLFCFQVSAIDSFPLSHSRYVVTAFITRAPACCENKIEKIVFQLAVHDGASCICRDYWTDTQEAVAVWAVAVYFNTPKCITKKAGQSIFTKILSICISCGELLIFSQHLSMCIQGKLFSLLLPKNSSMCITRGELFIFCTTSVSVRHNGSCCRFLHKIWQCASWLYL